MRNKLLIIVAIVVLALIIGIYFYFKERGPVEEPSTTATLSQEGLTQKAIQELNPLSNPLEEKPNLNPAEKANPLKNLKLNPFE